MKNILCFGDSNTYGYKPDGTGRYDFSVRYPGRLQAILGKEYHVIEEGCPGRTTVFEDKDYPYRKGIDYITPCLQSHNPIDYVVLMLGTNDCKVSYRATNKEIAWGLAGIVEKIRTVSGKSTGIIIISPIHLGPNIGKPGYDPEFDSESVEVLKTLALAYRELAQKADCDYLDASYVALASPIDEEHLDEAGHNKLAMAVTEIIESIENRGRETRHSVVK